MEIGEILEKEVKYEMGRIQSLEKDYKAGVVDFVTYEVMKAFHEGKLGAYNEIRRTIYAE